ncbi:hypothetical protein ACFT9I_02280 [Streptomyces sp. NPDC057137]|uniref:hypothetical protein n=1 Tax=Streptomyces sp. NPDC057137 TaxID=3346030 RepID=UPI00363CA0EA
MPTSRSIDSWQQVDSRADFATYLRFLAVDCERACDVQDSEAPTAQHWTHPSVHGFLWGWVRLLGNRTDGTDLLYEEAPDRPGWRGLAHQLDTVRTTQPVLNWVLADSDTKHEEVDTAGDLRMYAATLATDFARDQREMRASTERGEWAGDGGSWAHNTLHDWLAAWAAWVGTDSPRHTRLDPVTWRTIALQLSVARIYE